MVLLKDQFCSGALSLNSRVVSLPEATPADRLGARSSFKLYTYPQRLVDKAMLSILKWIVGALAVIVLVAIALMYFGVVSITGGSNITIVGSNLISTDSTKSYCVEIASLDEAVRCLSTNASVMSDAKYQVVITAMIALQENDLESATTHLASFAKQNPFSEQYAIIGDLLSGLLVARSAWNEIIELASDKSTMEYIGPSAKELGAVFGSAPQAKVHKAETLTTRPLRPIRTGQPAVDIVVDGKKFRFLLDTGAGVHVVASDVAEALNIRTVDGDSIAAGTSTSQQAQLTPAILPEMKIGDLIFENTPVTVIDHKSLEVGLGPIKLVDVDGIIGWPLFAQFAVELDHTNRTVTFSQNASNCTSDNFFWYGYPVVRAETNEGTPLLFGLDTGAQGISLHNQMVDRLKISTFGDKESTVIGAGGAEKVAERQLDDLKLTLGGKVLMLEAPTASPSLLDLPIRLDGIVSSNGIGAQKVDIDFPNGCFQIAD